MEESLRDNFNFYSDLCLAAGQTLVPPLVSDSERPGAARERCLWQIQRLQWLGSHLRLQEQSEMQMLSGNPEQAAC